MLSMLEEVVLLAVDENSGGLRSTREFGTAYALVGAVFFDLALARKIDTDTENVQIIDTKATGNATLDRVLARMAARPDLKTVRAWIEQIFQQRDVRVRLAHAIAADEIPETRDIMLVSIAEPCGLLGYVLSDSDLSRRRSRIQMLCNLETISRTVTDAILGLESTLRRFITRVV